MTITEFLTARLDEDDAAVRANWNAQGATDERWWGTPFQPSRALADIAAKRAIVALHKPLDNPHILGPARCAECGGNDVRPDATGVLEDHPWAMPWPCPTLRHLVQPYAEHADFDPAWRV